MQQANCMKAGLLNSRARLLYLFLLEKTKKDLFIRIKGVP